jgi:hypothetical protein
MDSSRIEELPDDFDESLALNKATQQGPAPPPKNKNVSLDEMFEKRLEGPNAISDKSFEEIMYDMSKTPLFMNAADVANQSMSIPTPTAEVLAEHTDQPA